MKRCTHCFVTKVLDEFQDSPKSIDGKTSHCSQCLEHTRRWRKTHKEHRQQYELAYREKQRELTFDIWENYDKLAKRFYAKIQYCEHGPDCPYCCHLWLAATAAGYGQFTMSPRNKILAHRMAWVLHNKRELSPDRAICHHCDVKKCCNFSHVFNGTDQDNTDDMRKKGRADWHGRGITWVNLTKPDITMIRLLDRQGFNQRLLAKTFHVSQGTISCIVLRKTWKHI